MSVSASRIVVLTGAGVSAESGVATFRASDGLWYEHRIEDVATPEGFARDPALVHRFYNERRKALRTVHPNAAHEALAAFESRFLAGEGREYLLITQNIDDLHERAGSSSLVHMHGEIAKMSCTACAAICPTTQEISTGDRCPGCAAAGGLRPHVVWFGEMPLELERIYAALARCEIFISIGTSGNVSPASDFVRTAKEAGAYAAELNLEPSAGSDMFDEVRHGAATEVVPPFLAEIGS